MTDDSVGHRPSPHTVIRWCTQCLITPPSRNCKRHDHQVIDAAVVPADSWRLRSDFDVVPAAGDAR